MTGKYKRHVTQSMLYGIYFESLILGRGNSSIATDLPRLSSGKKGVDQLRIEDAAHQFSRVAESYGMIINDKNVQVKAQKNYELPDNHPYKRQLNITVEGTGDLITPMVYRKIEYPEFCIDIKLALNRDNLHGEFCWGAPEYMDHTQGILYSTLFELPFAYMIWDYKKDDRGHKLIMLNTLANYINREIIPEIEGLFQQAKRREFDLYQSISLTIDKIIQYETEGWPAEPSYSLCTNCPLSPQNGGDCDEFSHVEHA